VKSIGLLVASNAFMTAAWYGHLRFRTTALWKVILVSWLIAFVFVAFAWLYLGESPRWNEAVAFLMVLGAVVVATLPR
jgi:uncharacterized protein (DUF486 family)